MPLAEWLCAASANGARNVLTQHLAGSRRIDQGVASGELTRREQHRLEHQQQHVANVETRVESDGTVTAKEALRLEHAQDRASRNIHRKKHNRRDVH